MPEKLCCGKLCKLVKNNLDYTALFQIKKAL